MIKKKILCDHCRGTGAASDSDIHKCSGCDGTGVKITRQQIWPGMFAQSQVTYVLKSSILFIYLEVAMLLRVDAMNVVGAGR